MEIEGVRDVPKYRPYGGGGKVPSHALGNSTVLRTLGQPPYSLGIY